MAKTRFTNANLKKLQPGDWTDPRYPNLVFRVGERARTWLFRPPRRADGSRPGIKLGRFPDLDATFAVKRYEDERARRARGELPPDLDERIRELEAELQALKRAAGKLVTFQHLAERFLEEYVPKSNIPLAPDTAAAYRQTLRDYALPHWADRDVEQMEEEEIEAVVNALAKKKVGQAARLLKVLKAMFSWGIRKKIVNVNPCTNIANVPVRRRSRILFPEEIRLAWESFPEAGETAGRALRLLLLTMQRRSEVVEVPWAEIQNEWWHLPGGKRTKNRDPNLIYLGPLARGILDQCRAARPDSPYVFPTMRRADRPFNKSMITRGCQSVSQALVEAGKITKPFRTHDLRRTAATTLRSLGADRRVVQRMLNHKSVTVTDVYDLYGMKPEIQHAFTLWDQYIQDLVGIRLRADG